MEPSCGQPVRDAALSDCGQWRYVLERRWAPRVGRESTVLFVGLNPSTADASVDDPTIRRCMGFARDWGFKRLYVANLFAYRTPYPENLLQANDPTGPDNDAWLVKLARRSQLVLACWGCHGQHLGRDREVALLLKRRLHCLAVNNEGSPAHPLYQRREAQPLPYPHRRLLQTRQSTTQQRQRSH